jgi:sulfonate transport system permease protein
MTLDVRLDVADPFVNSGNEPPELEVPLAPARRTRYRTARVGLRALLPLTVLGLWWLLSGLGWVPTNLLPGPVAIAQTFWSMLSTQNLVGQLGVSLTRAAVGLAVGGTIGLVLGIAVGLSRLGEELVDSSMQLLRTVPFIALSPLFIVWLGIGNVPKETLIALACSFPIYLNTSNGVRNVDRKMVEAARSFGLGGTRLIREVILPSALPSILTGLRYATGISVLALVAAEQIATTAGLGYLMLNAEQLVQVNVIFVCVVLYAVLGIGGDLLVRGLERTLLPWRRVGAVR